MTSGYGMESDLMDNVFTGQSELYVSVATAYRTAMLQGATGQECELAATRAVRSAHPFFLEKEAQRLAARIVAQFSELYPQWLPTRKVVDPVP